MTWILLLKEWSFKSWCRLHLYTSLHCAPFYALWFFSVTKSSSMQPHGLQHAKLSCPSPSLRVCSNSCPLSQWCLPTISSSVFSFSSCPRSFPASGSFPVSQLFTSSSQSVGASVLASVLPIGYSGWISFRNDWFGLLAVQGTLKNLLQHHNLKASISWC